MCLNHLKTTPSPNPGPWRNCLPCNLPLVPKMLRTTAPELPKVWPHVYGKDLTS